MKAKTNSKRTSMPQKVQIPSSWIEEIVNETEHYFQSEMQQDQRASWLLATASALLTLLIGLQVTAAERGVAIPLIPFFFALIAYFLSTIVSIIVMLPMRGIQSPWKDLWGISHRKHKRLDVDTLIKARFRHDDKWSEESFETRLKHHFRSHYLRNSKKSYGIIWSSFFLLIGLLSSATLAIILYLKAV
jgi:hypothetical protein